MTPNEIEHAILALFDGTADEATASALVAELKTNPAVRELYYEHAELQQALSTRFSHGSSNENATILSNFRLRSQLRTVGIFAAASAAAVLMLSAEVIRSAIFSDPTRRITYETAAGTRMTVSRAGRNPKPTEIAKGAFVQLEQGSIDLKFNHGSRALILAPARFSFSEDNSLLLNQGTGWFRIDKEDHGFKVITKELEVTNLGTECGVVSDLENPDQVHVFKGRVAAKILGTGYPQEELGEGESRASESDGSLVKIPSHPWAFLVRLPESASDGLIVNGGFESGMTPPDATFGVTATPSYLPGWRFGKEITVVRATSEGKPGYGAKDITILSSTADIQVGFNSNAVERPAARDVCLYQTFATERGQEYEVSFEMGGIFFSRATLKVAATVSDGVGRSGTVIARHIESRQPREGHGYNPPTSFRFKAVSRTTTLEFTEISVSTYRADPVIDNISVKPVH